MAPTALDALKRAAEAAPGDAAVWERYVAALYASGRKAAARKAARQAKVPGPERRRLLAIADGKASAPLDDVLSLFQAGRLAEARKLSHAVATEYPRDPRVLNIKGAIDLAAGDPLAAEIALKQALKLDPGSVDIRANLGLALARQGRATEAIRVMEKVNGRQATPALRTNLASAYLGADRPAEALDAVIDVRKEDPRDGEALAVHATALLDLGRAGEALDILGEAAKRNDFDLHDLMADAVERARGRRAAMDYVAQLSGISTETERRLARRLAEWGELEEAGRRARAVALRDPHDAEAVHIAGTVGRWKDGDPLIAVMEQGLANKAISPERRGTFGLALTKAHMDLGHHSRAFEAMAKGNRLLRSLVDYDVETDLKRFEATAATWTRDVIGRLAAGGPDIAPVFIVGLPRCGSTLMETILSRHPRVVSLSETPRMLSAALGGRPDEPTVKRIRTEARGILDPGDGRIATDKMLANFQVVGALAAALPNARFIEARRDLRAVGLSIFQARLGMVAHPYSMDLREIGRYAAGYAGLMAHWEAALPDRLTRIDYEALVSEPANMVPALVAAAGLEWDEACLGDTPPERRIDTLSVAQAREPIHTRSVERWRHYEAELAPMIDVLIESGAIPAR